MKNTHKQYLVLGAGITGWSVVSYLLAQGHSVRVTDSREVPPNGSKIKAVLSEQDICFGYMQWQWLTQAEVVIVSPGIDSRATEIQAAIAMGVEVIGDIELFARSAKKPYLAITGSNGKSTVTTLATAILASQNLAVRAGANIGEPALNLLVHDDLDMYVLELSSFQLETCQSLSPAAAAVLNITHDHLDRHEDLAQYKQIKLSIFNHAKRTVTARQEIFDDVCTDTSFGTDLPEEGHYGIGRDECGQEWLMHGDSKIIQSDDISLLGEIGKLNVLAALALTEPYIKDMPAALDSIKQFKGLPHRSELTARVNNIIWINDSKATNIGATIAALNGIDRPVILILGGVHKGGSITDIVPAIKQKVKHLIVLGEAAELFASELQNQVNTTHVADLDGAVIFAHQQAIKGDAVLLSPACASFDMFDNYEHRGEVFRSAVNNIHSGVCYDS